MSEGPAPLSRQETTAALADVDRLLDARPAVRTAADAARLSDQPRLVRQLLDLGADAPNGHEGGGNGFAAVEAHAIAERARGLVEPAPGDVAPDEGDGAGLAPGLTELARGLFADAVRERRLADKRAWAEQAVAQLGELARGEARVDDTVRPVAADAGAEVARAVGALLSDLSRNASEIAMLEVARRDWVAAVDAARDAIRYRGEMARNLAGAELSPEPRLHLQLVRALFMRDGRVTPELRAELAGARESIPDAPGIAFAAGRYALMPATGRRPGAPSSQRPTTPRLRGSWPRSSPTPPTARRSGRTRPTSTRSTTCS